MKRLTRAASALTLAGVLGLSLAACGDDDPKDDETTSSESESESTDDSESTDEGETDDSEDVTEPEDDESDETEGGDDPSLPVADSEFCEVFVGSFDAIGTDDIPSEENWAAFQAELEKLEEIGIPDGATEEQQRGFEVFTEALLDLDYAEVRESFDDDELPGVSPEDNKAAEAFTQWAFENCLDFGDIPTEGSTEQ